MGVGMKASGPDRSSPLRPGPSLLSYRYARGARPKRADRRSTRASGASPASGDVRVGRLRVCCAPCARVGGAQVLVVDVLVSGPGDAVATGILVPESPGPTDAPGEPRDVGVLEHGLEVPL